MHLKIIGLIALLWAGMVLGISFLESWVKFRAPSLTKQIGLDVGRTVFGVFHKVQNILLLSVIGFSLIAHTSLFIKWMISGITLILCTQFFWLLPQLNHRVDILIAGNTPPRSYVHALYGISELLKFVFLILLGWHCFTL